MVPTQSVMDASSQPATEEAMPKPLAPLPAPVPPKPKVQMTMMIDANFSRLGLDDEEKRANFSRDFTVSMRTKLGGNNVIVNSVTAGDLDGYGDDVHDSDTQIILSDYSAFPYGSNKGVVDQREGF